MAEAPLARRARHDFEDDGHAGAGGYPSGATAAAANKGKPCLHYFPLAGRGELTRLIAAAGGVEIDESHSEVEDKASFGSPGSLPVLAHGRLKIAQSFAIESYIASIAPIFVRLDPAQRAIDAMFCKIKEDVLEAFADVVGGFSLDDSQQASVCEDVATIANKWFPVIEGRLPELELNAESLTHGFINGLSFPTPADLAVFNMVESFMPFKAAYHKGGYDVRRHFPKTAAHALRVAGHPTIKEYIERSATLMADPVGIAQQPQASPQGQVVAQVISAYAIETAELWHNVDCPVPDCAVVWLHSLGESEVYWQEVFEHYDILQIPELGEVRWIMPRADATPCTARSGALTFQWFDTQEFPVCLIVSGVPNRARKDENADEIHAAVHRVHEAVLALEVEGVPAERIIVAGFGQGGALAVHAATSYPKQLAGCAMLSGYVPCCKSVLVEAVSPANKDLEVLWLHGVHDGVVQIDAATAQAAELTELGIRLDFRLSLDFGHETTEEELKAFRHWLIKQIKGPESVAATRRVGTGNIYSKK